MSEAATEKRRRGGREARRALRATREPRARRPVRGGLEGGRYKPLSEGEVARIHGAVLDLLEQVGLGAPIPSCVELLTAAGCSLSEEGRLLFPRALVEDSIAAAGRRFVLHGQDPQHDTEPWRTRVYFGAAGAAVQTVDRLSGAYRDSTLEDLYDAARIVDALEHVHFFQRTVVPCDRASPKDWLEQGADSVVERAARKTRAILSSPCPRPIPDPLDARIRSTFEVKLPRQTMSPKPAGGASEHGGES